MCDETLGAEPVDMTVDEASQLEDNKEAEESVNYHIDELDEFENMFDQSRIDNPSNSDWSDDNGTLRILPQRTLQSSNEVDTNNNTTDFNMGNVSPITEPLREDDDVYDFVNDLTTPSGFSPTTIEDEVKIYILFTYYL